MEFNTMLKTGAQRAALRLICTGQNVSRIDIARELGMPKMTVTNVVSELIRQELVEAGEARTTGGAGRRPIVLSVSGSAPLVLGMCIMRGECSAILSDLSLNVLRTEHMGIRGPSDSFERDMVALIDRFADAMPRVGAVGISSIGPVDTESGVIVNPPAFFGIENVSVVDIVSRHTGKPIYFNNDVKCSALAEHLFGVARGCDDFLELSISNGIGSGIMEGGRLYQRECGASGEMGHVSIDYAGPVCACGNRGCLECYATIPTMEARLKAVSGMGVSFREYCGMRDRRVEEALRDMLDKIACALIGQVNMLNPECVVICNEGAYLRDDHLAYLERQVNLGKLSKHHTRPVRIARSSFGAQSALYGSIGVVLDHLFRADAPA